MRTAFAEPPSHESVLDFYEWDAEVDEYSREQAALQVGRAACEVTVSPESRKSFDPMASVKMMRADLALYRRILPETDRRVHDEELSRIAEGVGRVARTSFKLRRGDNGDLLYRDNGRWRPYIEMLETGLQVAISEAVADPRKRFLADLAEQDLKRGWEMCALRPGEQMAWASPYRYDVQAAVDEQYSRGLSTQTGAEFMRRQCGFDPQRKMAFLYLAHCHDNGTVELLSQTVDRSDSQALAAALRRAEPKPGSEPDAVMDEMVDANDDVMRKKLPTDDTIYAGRLGAEIRENIWLTILHQKDLVQYLMDGLKGFARQSHRRELVGRPLEDAVKKHVYGVWAAFKTRIDGGAPLYTPLDDGFPPVHALLVHQEVNRAFTDFARRGIPMLGCGGAIEMLQGERDILDADPTKVFDGIFGKGDDPSKDCDFISKTCPNCQAKNVRTISKIRSGKRYVSGSCGCKKVYPA